MKYWLSGFRCLYFVGKTQKLKMEKLYLVTLFESFYILLESNDQREIVCRFYCKMTISLEALSYLNANENKSTYETIKFGLYISTKISSLGREYFEQELLGS